MDDTSAHGSHQEDGDSASANGANGAGGEDLRELTAQARTGIDAAMTHNGAVSRDTPGSKQKYPRHPETPYTSLPADVPRLVAAEIGDPIAKTVLTAMLGKGAWMLSEAVAFGKERGIEPLAQAVANVRKGAYVVQAKREGQPDRELIASTSQAVEALRFDGDADAQKADRVAQSIPRLTDNLQAALEERNVAQHEREAAFATRAQAREQEEARLAALQDDIEHAKRSDRALAHRLKQLKIVPALGKAAPPIALVGAVMVIDGAVTTLILQPAIAKTIDIDPMLAYPLAGGVSVGVLMAAAVAGVMFAASRVPARVAAGGLAALFVAIMTQFLPGLELLREGQTEGLKSLTTATAIAAYVAFGVAYAHGVFRDATDERKLTGEHDPAEDRARVLLARAGSPLQDACDELDRAEDKLAAAVAKCEELERELDATYTQIEALRDAHARVEAQIAGREGEAERAKVRGTVAQEVIATQQAQEDESVVHAVNTAYVWWAITGAEAREPDDAATVPTPTHADALDRVNAPVTERRSVIVAIAALVAAGLLGLLLGPVAFAIGAVVAAVALIAPLLGLRRRRAGAEDDAAPMAISDAPASDHIGGLIDVDDPTWSEMPSRMVPRYRAVDADPGESH